MLTELGFELNPWSDGPRRYRLSYRDSACDLFKINVILKNTSVNTDQILFLTVFNISQYTLHYIPILHTSEQR